MVKIKPVDLFIIFYLAVLVSLIVYGIFFYATHDVKSVIIVDSEEVAVIPLKPAAIAIFTICLFGILMLLYEVYGLSRKEAKKTNTGKQKHCIRGNSLSIPSRERLGVGCLTCAHGNIYAPRTGERTPPCPPNLDGSRGVWGRR